MKLKVLSEKYLPGPRWRLTLAALTLVIIFSLIVFGQMVMMEIRYARLEAELSKYEKLWDSKAISNYGYILSGSAGDTVGYAEVAVRVEDGVAISEVRKQNSTGETFQMLEDIDQLDTVPELYDRIRQAIKEKDEDGTNKLAVQYDTVLGYPTYIALVDRRGYAIFTIGMYSYRIENFRIQEPKEVRYARLEAELDRYEDLWNSKQISDYEYTIIAANKDGYPHFPVRVGGRTTVYADTGVNDTLDISNLDTVPELFDRIRKAVREKEEVGFNELNIRYNPDFGYPTYIALRDSYKTGNPGIYSYSIVDFKILE